MRHASEGQSGRQGAGAGNFLRLKKNLAERDGCLFFLQCCSQAKGKAAAAPPDVSGNATVG